MKNISAKRAAKRKRQALPVIEQSRMVPTTAIYQQQLRLSPRELMRVMVYKKRQALPVHRDANASTHEWIHLKWKTGQARPFVKTHLVT